MLNKREHPPIELSEIQLKIHKFFNHLIIIFYLNMLYQSVMIQCLV